jgi:iron-sulfur cluster repair protein YtfE (RIC family)
MNYDNLSNIELIREVEASQRLDLDIVNALVTRLDSTIVQDTSHDDELKDACVSHLCDVSGEDHHYEIIERLRQLVNIKTKKDREDAINGIIETLSNMDYTAMNLIIAIKSDGIIL